MTPTETFDSAFASNHRDVTNHAESSWRRPSTARSTSFDQPMSQALPDMTLRDGAWRRGDSRDLYALAALSIGFAIVAAALSLLTA